MYNMYIVVLRMMKFNQSACLIISLVSSLVLNRITITLCICSLFFSASCDICLQYNDIVDYTTGVTGVIVSEK